MKRKGNSNLTIESSASPERTPSPPPDMIRSTDCVATGLTVMAAIRRWLFFECQIICDGAAKEA